MLPLLLVIIGGALIVGAKDWAASLVRPLIGLILVLSFAPPLLDSCQRVNSGTLALKGAEGIGLGTIALASVALLGFVLWRVRSGAHGHDGRSRAALRARERALPPPPPEADPGVDGDHWLFRP